MRVVNRWAAMIGFVVMTIVVLCAWITFSSSSVNIVTGPASAQSPSRLHRVEAMVARVVKDRLENGVESEVLQPPFEDVLIGTMFPSHFMVGTREADDPRVERKIISPVSLLEKGEMCLVYGLGIAGSMNFEIAMRKLGCEVFAFDCTADEARMKEIGERHGVTFLPWCVGEKRAFGDTVFTRGHAKDREYAFYTLDQVMSKLGHKSVSLLKFDIEGFEWMLFDSLLKNRNLPTQLLFELHTEGVTPIAVAPQVVKGKRRGAVNKLFLELQKRGYVVYDKIQNPTDTYAADFTLLKVN
jgi:hypothetical protein